MRLFFAINIPAELKTELADRLAASRKTAPLEQRTWRWTNPEAWHVTLVFLGEQEPGCLPGLLGLASTLAERSSAFSLTTSSHGAFPDNAAARVLWLGVAASPGLDHLASSLRASLKTQDISFDERSFQAHLTLARSPRPLALGDWALPWPKWNFTVNEFGLYESQVGRAGAAYRQLAVFRLALGAAA